MTSGFCSPISRSMTQQRYLLPARCSSTGNGAPATTTSTFRRSYAGLPLALDSYGEGGLLVSRERVGEQLVDDVVRRQLSDPKVEYLHLRNAEAGCFIARIDPVFACD